MRRFGTILAIVVGALTVSIIPAGAQQQLWYDQFPVGGIIPIRSLASVDVATDPADNVYAGGWADQPLAGQTTAGAYLRKYDPGGNEIWTRQFADAIALSVAVDGLDAAYVTGTTDVTLPGSPSSGDIWVRKYDPAGTLLWTRQLGAGNFSRPSTVAVDGSGNPYVVGLVRGALPGQIHRGETDAFVRKYDASGSELWTSQFGTDDIDDVIAGDVDATGNSYATGATFGTFPGGTNPGGFNTFVARHDAAGTLQWVRQFGTDPGGVEPNDLEADPFGNVYVLAREETLVDILLLRTATVLRKFRSDGSSVFERRFYFPAEGPLPEITIGGAGLLYLAGTIADPVSLDDDSHDVFLVKLGTNGKEIWRTRVSASGNQERVDGLSIDPSGNLIVGGVADQVPVFGGTTGDVFIMKVDQSPTCSDTSNPTENEDGLISRAIHLNVEPIDSLQPTVHELNCTVVAPLGL
jgi:hypothetical protein